MAGNGWQYEKLGVLKHLFSTYDTVHSMLIRSYLPLSAQFFILRVTCCASLVLSVSY